MKYKLGMVQGEYPCLRKGNGSTRFIIAAEEHEWFVEAIAERDWRIRELENEVEDLNRVIGGVKHGRE